MGILDQIDVYVLEADSVDLLFDVNIYEVVFDIRVGLAGIMDQLLRYVQQKLLITRLLLFKVLVEG